MKPSALARLDLVLGSFHSSLGTTEDQTKRYLAALRNPSIQILGHPRGRIYNYRLGLRADWPRVFGEAAELDKAVEIDCYPDRQDLNLALSPNCPTRRSANLIGHRRSSSAAARVYRTWARRPSSCEDSSRAHHQSSFRSINCEPG